MFQIDYRTKDDVVHVVFSGKINLAEILRAVKKLGEIKGLSQDLIIIKNFVDAEFDFKPTAVALVSAEIKEFVLKFRTVRVASIYSTPRDTAYGQLIEHYSSIRNYDSKIFQSIDAAYAWLKPVQCYVD